MTFTNRFANPLKKPQTLSDILNVFTETQNKLQEFITATSKISTQKQDEMKRLEEELKEAAKEVDKARKAFEQINKIVGE